MDTKAFDINKLTLGEIAQLEDATGQSISAFADDTAPKGRLLAGLAWIAGRRRNPAFTLNEAEALTMPELQELIGGEEDPKAKA